jgi:hypothetical protein
MDPLPIFSHSDALAVELLGFADAVNDDGPTQEFITRQRDVAGALAEARRTLANARRVPGYPKKDLGVLEVRVARADAEAATVQTDLTTAVEARLRRAQAARGHALNAALLMPAGVDAAEYRAEKSMLTERLERDVEAGERAVMLKSSARDNTNLPLLRAALTAPQPAWPTAKWQPLLSDKDAEECREWLIAHRAPESVKDIRAAWRLGRLAQELELARAGQSLPPTTPSLADSGAIRVGSAASDAAE